MITANIKSIMHPAEFSLAFLRLLSLRQDYKHEASLCLLCNRE